MTKPSMPGLVLLGVAACTFAGCSRTPPAVTEAEGTVLLNGKPLPNVKVEFIPQLDYFGAEYKSSAITDEKGFFRLTCAHQQQPGAAVAKHKVLVSEAPPSDEFRRPDGDSQARYAAYLRGLTNRPIPEEYASLRKTPLQVDVTAGQRTYDLKLTR